MLASILLAEKGIAATVLEKEEKTGKKLYITGKGRCNFTNDCTRDEFLDAVVTNPRFLYSSFDALSPQDLIALFESYGLKSVVQRGRRVFPESEKSADVLDMLRGRMKKLKVRTLLNAEAKCIEPILNGYEVAYAHEGTIKKMEASCVLLSTGGLSYPSTGSTGDGFKMAGELGIEVKPCRPSLVALSTDDPAYGGLAGLSLRNVELTVRKGKKKIFSEFGEMLFTHDGFSGPLILSASARAGGRIGKEELSFEVDLKPAVAKGELDARITRLAAASPKKAVGNCIAEMYPKSLVPVVLDFAGVPFAQTAAELTREQRQSIVDITKHFPLKVKALKGYNEAVVTSGGIAVREIDPATMELKRYPGLYAAGEIIDVDAVTGGYNLQIAWMTAAQAAGAIAERVEELRQAGS